MAKADFIWSSSGLVLTGEFKSVSGQMQVECVITGLTDAGSLAVLLQTRFAIPCANEKEAIAFCNTKKQELLSFYLGLNAKLGLALSPNTDIFERESICAVHLIAHMESFSNAELNVRTLRQYQLCKSLGITKYVEFLSRLENVPISTIRKRLDKCRELGMLPVQNRTNKSRGDI